MKKLGFCSLLAAAIVAAGTTPAFALQDAFLQTGLTPSIAAPPQPNALGPLYNAGGFEGFANGTLAGQNNFTSIGTAPFTVGATTGLGGTKGVTATPTAAGTTYYYPTTTAYTPQVGELVSINIDLSTSDPNLSAADNTGFIIDVYSNAGRIGRFGLFIGTNTIRVGVTSRFNTTTGQFDPNSTTVNNVTLSGALTANTFYNLEGRFNFANRTFDLYSGGNLFYANIPFSSAVGTADTSFSDGDLSSVGIANGANTAVFDNYAVNVIAVPEPSTVILMAGAGLAGVVLRRRRR